MFCTGLNCTLDVPYSLFGENRLGIKNYDFSTVDSQIEMMLSYAPDVLFNVMIHLDTRPWYLANNPECTNTYYNLVEMAGYEKWRSDTAQYLEDIVNYIESRYGEKVFSYSLFCFQIEKSLNAFILKDDYFVCNLINS